MACLLNATLLWVSSAFYFLLLASLFFLWFFLLLSWSSRILFYVCSWLKANLCLHVLLLFHPFGSPAIVHLDFPASVLLPMSHREWPLVLLRISCGLPRRFGTLVMLWNDSSPNSLVKSNFKLLYASA